MSAGEMGLIKVIIDADSCPKTCLAIIQALEREYPFTSVTVASFNHQINHPNHIVVGDQSQAADIYITNLVSPEDIVVTNNWGLAAMVLGKKAAAISPSGRVFDPDRIEIMLNERHLLACVRRSGQRTKGPSKRSKQEDLAFREGLTALLLSRLNPK